MARNEIYIEASPERVFGVLSDPHCYPRWVLGTHAVRGADPDWPQPGALFHHTVGMPPLALSDDTRIITSAPPVRLELLARARPFPSARVVIELAPERDGTRVTMIEDPASRVVSLLAGPLGQLATLVRNAESLRRLKRIAESTTRRAVVGVDLPG